MIARLWVQLSAESISSGQYSDGWLSTDR